MLIAVNFVSHSNGTPVYDTLKCNRSIELLQKICFLKCSIIFVSYLYVLQGIPTEREQEATWTGVR